jgi:regulator of replication initiation timing
LEHNDKLVIENTDLKKRLNEAEVIGNSFMQKERLSRYQQVEESEYAVRRINSELLIKNREIENIIS